MLNSVQIQNWLLVIRFHSCSVRTEFGLGLSFGSMSDPVSIMFRRSSDFWRRSIYTSNARTAMAVVTSALGLKRQTFRLCMTPHLQRHILVIRGPNLLLDLMVSVMGGLLKL